MRKALLIIDMQKDFITGSLGTKEAQAIVKNVLGRAEKAKKEKIDIIFTKDTHYDNYLETQEGKKLPIKHCIEGTSGWELCDELKEYETSKNLYKKNTFGCVELAQDIKDKYDEVELIGLCTDICVISNAMLIKAFNPEITVKVIQDCCAGVTPDSHKNALEAMKMCQIDIV